MLVVSAWLLRPALVSGGWPGACVREGELRTLHVGLAAPRAVRPPGDVSQRPGLQISLHKDARHRPPPPAMQLQGGSSAVFAPLWRIWLCVAPLRAVGPTPAQDEERDTQSHTS